MAQRRYPPVALIECVADIAQSHHKVRRLHLVIVDLWRPWKINALQIVLRRCHHSQERLLSMDVGLCIDGSDFPCYLLWPVRTPTGSCCLLESQTQQYVDMEHIDYLHPLGLRHFYDGFSLRAEVSIRIPALEAFQLQEEDISPDLVLSLAAVAARGRGGHQEQPVDHNAPEADRRNVPDNVISVGDGELDQESSLGEESSYACDSSASEGKESSDSEPAMSEVSDQYSMLEHAYQSIRIVFSTTSEGKLVGGDGLKSTGKSSGALAISQAYAAVEVWCQSTRRAVGRLPDRAQGHAFGSIQMPQADQLICQNTHSSSCHVPCKGNCCTIPPSIISPPHVPY